MYVHTQHTQLLQMQCTDCIHEAETGNLDICQIIKLCEIEGLLQAYTLAYHEIPICLEARKFYLLSFCTVGYSYVPIHNMIWIFSNDTYYKNHGISKDTWGRITYDAQDCSYEYGTFSIAEVWNDACKTHDSAVTAVMRSTLVWQKMMYSVSRKMKGFLYNGCVFGSLPARTIFGTKYG
jgi:hypothetical protein